MDLRYRGQSDELTVPCRSATDTGAVALEHTIEAFHQRHERFYGHSLVDGTIEIVNLRATGLVPTLGIEETAQTEASDPIRTTLEVHFEDVGSVETDFYRRTALSAGTVVYGPAVLEEGGSTIVVPPKHEAEVTGKRSVVIRWGPGHETAS